MKPEVIVVGYENYDFASSLVVGEIVFWDRELELEGVEALIFTSKNAIRALAYNACRYPKMQMWRQIPSYVIGKGSARELEQEGGNLAFVCDNFHSRAFVRELKPRLNETRALYLRAKESFAKLEEQLEGVSLRSEILYENRIKNPSFENSDIMKPPPNAILLFTAPSSYRFFVQSFGWDESYVAVAIGKSTLESMPVYINKRLAPTQGIRESVEILRGS